MRSGRGKIRGRWRARNGILLQAPGRNTATLGSLVFGGVYALVLIVYWVCGQDVVTWVYGTFGLNAEGMVRGEGWRLLTHLFLHGSFPHLLVNVILFYYASARLSHVLTSWRIVALFLVTGLAAGVAQVYCQAWVPGWPEETLVGASGGIMGLLLGWFSMSPGSRMILFHIAARNLARGVLLSSFLLVLMTPSLGLPFFSELGRRLPAEIFQVAHLVHFVGGIVGWVGIARFLPRLLSASDLAEMRVKREAREGRSPSLTVGSAPD